MKRLLLLFLILSVATHLWGAPFNYLPHKVTQPDGTIINCFVSGDEFFNWIHDIEGYSVIRGDDGFYYYATKVDESIVASQYRVNSVSPEAVGLKKGVRISRDEYLEKRKRFEIPVKGDPVKAPHTGIINNLVIYIRFSGDSEIETTRAVYDDKLNKVKAASLKTYFREVSYQQLTIGSTHYPSCDEPVTTNTSYEDSHTRGYFQPYDATTNPIGYEDDTEARYREHQLLKDAINWINANDAVPAGLNIDMDDDGYVDNTCFMIKGESDAWSDLLWAHRWALWTYTVYINGKTVWDYTFQPENQVSVKTLCHEMFHTLSAPDLYHYDDGGLNLDPVGYWDIMEHGSGHMGAYMKWKYSDEKWISSIPVITEPGTYTINPLTSSTNNCYKIPSPNSSKEFFIVEYRQQSGIFEENLPGEGLLVYRINSDFRGNANFDNESIFDEVYIYRPGGSPTKNGIVSNGYFSSDIGRTVINDMTDPNSFLHDNSAGGLNISSVTAAGETISFYVGMQLFEISAISDPPEGGTIAGTGEYYAGETVYLVATPSSGYLFVNWTEEGEIVSSSPSYSFPAASYRSLVAHFELPSFIVSTFVQPGNGGTISGGGTYIYGETAIFTATPYAGFDFVNWMENGIVVSTDPTYQITVTSNRTLIANFEVQTFEVATNVIPLTGGFIEGEGRYHFGEMAILYALAEPWYVFISWVENGVIISHQPGITFVVEIDRSFDANFALSTTISNLQETKEFEVFPNPTAGTLYIKSNRLPATISYVELYNSSGILVDQQQLTLDGVKKLNLDNLARGIYFLVIKGEGYSYTEKVIIE